MFNGGKLFERFWRWPASLHRFPNFVIEIVEITATVLKLADHIAQTEVVGKLPVTDSIQSAHNFLRYVLRKLYFSPIDIYQQQLRSDDRDNAVILNLRQQ